MESLSEFEFVKEGLHALHRVMRFGDDDGPEADAIREALDGPWSKLSPEDDAVLTAYSAALYELTLEDWSREVDPPLTSIV